MSKTKILAELPKLSPAERRELVATIFDLEPGAAILQECDERANERFMMLDRLEEQDAKTRST